MELADLVDLLLEVLLQLEVPFVFREAALLQNYS